MHEIALCGSILQILEQQSRAQAFDRVKTVRLEVGELAQVELEALRFGFDVVTRGTLADGARLEVVDVPGEAWCPRCRQSVRARERFDPCPACGGYHLRITRGEEFRVKELEVE